MVIQKEREAFECEFKQTNYYIAHGDLSTLMLCDGQYALDDVQVSFEMWQAAKAQAVPEGKGRSDFEIIDQTIELVDLIASSNRFQRDKSKPFPFESNNPRNIEWWRLACKIQELLTDTDPDNCDFEEYKAMIEAQEPQITELKAEWASDCFKCGHHEAIIYSTAAEASTKGWFHDGDEAKCTGCGNTGEMDAQGEDSGILWNEDEEAAKNA